ncbi:unnamed protein product [Porites evermanni]|uniref:MIP18 family-like domain-containing protein n=2 Tax=Porites evermanni TaxID=104178 RepID=A0ABN8SAU6_9CNID|nr:unnamed protein product [Porites evermanni]
MPLSSRAKGEKLRRPSDAKGTNYLICEPTAVGHAMNEANISRYAFRATLDRIPETDGEKLLNAHGKRKSNSGEQQKCGSPEKNAEANMKANEKSKTKMASTLENANPTVFQQKQERLVLPEEEDEDVVDKIDEREVFDILFKPLLVQFDLIRSINDPEHPLTLEQLNVVEQSLVKVDDDNDYVKIQFTPTIPHCSMATLIGLAIRVQLLRSLPDRFKVDVSITPGTHASEDAVNKQLADKERVAAALENTHLLEVVNQCLAARQ